MSVQFPHIRFCPLLLAFFMVAGGRAAHAQPSQDDSVLVTFRVYGAANTTHFVPGQFNDWGPNAGGTILAGAVSQMEYDSSLTAWTKTYVFKVHDAADIRRTLGDSVFMYKFNAGGSSSGWFPDPLSLEQNTSDNNNSVLRLTDRFWFQYRAAVAGAQIARITAGLVCRRSDTIVSVLLQHAPTQSQQLTAIDVTALFDSTTSVLDVSLEGLATIGSDDFVRLVAYTAAGDSLVVSRGGYTVTIAPMPAGLRHGATLPVDPASDSVGFRLMAPVGNVVILRIAPAGNPVALADPIVMNKHTSSADWWVYVPLQPGVYDYLFEIDGQRLVLDPWGRLHTAGGTRFTKGPAGLSADDYAWSSNGFVRPAQKDLVIYELHIGEFAGGYVGQRGTFVDMISVLPYLDSLGINAIELMPVTDWGNIGESGNSWGYDISSYFALEPSYGTPAEFKQLIDSAHARGMAVILDVVFNHMNDPSPLWQLAPDVSLNPYFKNPGGAYNEDGLVFFRDMDHWSLHTQEHVYDCLKMWIDEFRIDGFRYDYTQGIGWDIASPTRGILGWANRIDTEYNGSIYQIAEHLPESPALVYHSGISGGWHDSFRDRLFDEARFKNQGLVQLEDQVLGLGAFQGNDTPPTPARYGGRSEPVNYTISHDEQSLVYEMTEFQGVSADEAILRDKLYAVFMFTSLGIPMLWQGQETGESRGWTSDGEKLSYRPVDWTRMSTEVGRRHWTYYRALIRQRTFNPALTDGILRTLWRYDTNGQKVLVWGMEDTTGGAEVVVVANLGGTQQTVTDVPWLSSGVWYDVFTQSAMHVDGLIIPSLEVPAYTALVYANMPDSALHIPTSVHGVAGNAAPRSLTLHHNYPNPFNPRTTIHFELPGAGEVSITVHDLLGRRIAELVRGHREAGSHSITWDAHDGLSSGMYLVRLVANGYAVTRKISYVR